VVGALRERLRRERGRVKNVSARDELRGARERCARLPVRDRRTPDEILGHDESGLPR
jgi:antitoxin VapB